MRARNLFRPTPLFVLGVVAASACHEQGGMDLTELSSFQLTLTSGETGSAETPLDFPTTPLHYDFTVQAVDASGTPKSDWSGVLTLRAVPGELSATSATTVTAQNGVASGSLDLARAYGPIRLWVEDLGTQAAPGTYATGVSPTIWFRTPRIRDIQQSSSTVTSPFEGQSVAIDTGRLVVTSIQAAGFFVTDTSDTAWNSLYVYTYSRPDDIQRGDLLTQLTGNISEYLGFTELGNPSWAVSGATTLPDPTALDCTSDVLVGGLAMEKWESGLVSVVDATIDVCDTYPTCPDYDQYAQWSIALPCGARLNVISRDAAPKLNPAYNHARVVTKLRGTLRHIRYASPAWIIEPRDTSDICCPGCQPAMNEGCD